MSDHFIPYRPEKIEPSEIERRLVRDYEVHETRRTVRMFSPEPVSQTAIEAAIMTASTAPSGAHKQPWFFVAISDPEMKQRIRAAAEEEETE